YELETGLEFRRVLFRSVFVFAQTKDRPGGPSLARPSAGVPGRERMLAIRAMADSLQAPARVFARQRVEQLPAESSAIDRRCGLTSRLGPLTVAQLHRRGLAARLFLHLDAEAAFLAIGDPFHASDDGVEVVPGFEN